jgi:phosphoserine phosphatase
LALAIFDLDNTLLAGDSDYLWGLFLAEEGIVNREEYERENERFYREYKEGRLDIQEFMRFALRVLKDHEPEDLLRWRERFVRRRSSPSSRAPRWPWWSAIARRGTPCSSSPPPMPSSPRPSPRTSAYRT